MELHAYPVKYISAIKLADGTLVQLRPIHPMDGERAAAFKSSLSLESLYARFHGFLPEVNEKMIRQLTVIDYKNEMAIVAEVIGDFEKEAVAVSRIVRSENHSAEFAVIISDKWQGKKLGSVLTEYMIKIAKDMGFKSLNAMVQNQNTQMLEILRHSGFDFVKEDIRTFKANLKL